MSVPEPHSKGTLRRLMAFAARYRRACGGILLLQLGITSLVLAGLDLLGRGIDAIHLAQPDAHTPALTRVLWMAGGVLAAGLCATLLRLVVTLTQTRLIQRVIIDLRTSIYDHLQRLHFGFYDSAQSTSLINRVTADVQTFMRFL